MSQLGCWWLFHYHWPFIAPVSRLLSPAASSLRCPLLRGLVDLTLSLVWIKCLFGISFVSEYVVLCHRSLIYDYVANLWSFLPWLSLAKLIWLDNHKLHASISHLPPLKENRKDCWLPVKIFDVVSLAAIYIPSCCVSGILQRPFSFLPTSIDFPLHAISTFTSL